MPKRTAFRLSLGGTPGRVRNYVRGFSGLNPGARQLIASATMLWVGIGISGVLFNLYLIALGFNVAYVGLLAAVSTVGQASASPLMSRLLRRWSAREVMMAATGLVAMAMAACAVFTNAILLLLAVVVQGVAIAAASIPSSPFLMEQSTVEMRAHAFSGYVAATNLGSMAGSLISGLVPALCAVVPFLPTTSVAEDRIGLLIGAACTASGVLALLRISAEGVEQESGDSAFAAADGENADQDQARVDLIAMMTASALIAISLGVIYPLFNVYFSTVHHASTTTIGLLYALSGVVCTVAVLFGPILARQGTLRWLVTCRLVTVPILLVFMLHPALAIAFLAYITRNIFGGITGVMENAFSMEVVSANLRSAVASWRTFSYNVGWTVSALVAGIVVSRFGFNSVFVASAVFSAAGAGIWYYRFGRKAARRRYPLHAETKHP